MRLTDADIAPGLLVWVHERRDKQPGVILPGVIDSDGLCYRVRLVAKQDAELYRYARDFSLR